MALVLPPAIAQCVAHGGVPPNATASQLNMLVQANMDGFATARDWHQALAHARWAFTAADLLETMRQEKRP